MEGIVDFGNVKCIVAHSRYNCVLDTGQSFEAREVYRYSDMSLVGVVDDNDKFYGINRVINLSSSEKELNKDTSIRDFISCLLRDQTKDNERRRENHDYNGLLWGEGFIEACERILCEIGKRENMEFEDKVEKEDIKRHKKEKILLNLSEAALALKYEESRSPSYPRYTQSRSEKLRLLSNFTTDPSFTGDKFLVSNYTYSRLVSLPYEDFADEAIKLALKAKGLPIADSSGERFLTLFMLNSGVFMYRNLEDNPKSLVDFNTIINSYIFSLCQ